MGFSGVILLDTNVLSELAKPQPNPAVLTWADDQNPTELYTTSINEAEMLFGMALMPAGRRRDELARGVAAIFTSLLAGRVLPFDRIVAAEYAGWAAERRIAGRQVAFPDLQIAAIAIARGATAIATRNTKDFNGCGVPLIDPWTG